MTEENTQQTTLDMLLSAIANINEKYTIFMRTQEPKNYNVSTDTELIYNAYILLPDENLSIAWQTHGYKRLYALRRFLHTFNIHLDYNSHPTVANW